jgi:PAB-dependent poly(A)-specific ribonuclease subunit 2
VSFLFIPKRVHARAVAGGGGLIQQRSSVSELMRYRPLNLIGMPYYTEPLLSNIPTADYSPITSPFFNPPEPVPQIVLNNMKVLDFVGYAALPKELRGKRYVRTAAPGVGKRATGGAGKAGGLGSRRESAPRFRSEKDRKGRGSVVVDVEEEVS